MVKIGMLSDQRLSRPEFLKTLNTKLSSSVMGTRKQMRTTEGTTTALHVLCTRANNTRWLSWMHRPTGDQEVAGSTPAEVGNILSWRLIMKYFLRSFSPFC